MGDRTPVPVIDLFAGPGGLAEGFASAIGPRKHPLFRIAVSIEKEPIAHRTLSLRSAFRQFGKGAVPDVYYDYICGRIAYPQLQADPLMSEALAAAKNEARCATLGDVAETTVDQWINGALKQSDEWVLIGGPPCQAYSLVGRSRMANVDRSEFERDKRHELYKEYLRIIRRFHPPIFVMENVKGLLSSKLRGSLIFEQIREDLSRPAPGLEYEIRSFTQESVAGLLPKDFVIRSECFGLPQARHRVILLGVRSDYADRMHAPLIPAKTVSVNSVIGSMPKLRGRLSRGDSHEAWLATLKSTIAAMDTWEGMQRKEVLGLMADSIRRAKGICATGGAFVGDCLARDGKNSLAQWLTDERIGGWISHESRSHMASDLSRYFFASCFAREMGFSPRLREFPRGLLPDHRNVSGLLRKIDEKHLLPFDDRFKVQIADSPSSTIVSHIAKDGHYYIHPDPSQARSLTVREAARLQTFPDNYVFEGNRTEQFIQVGNAVPPFLARQLACVVSELMQARPTRGDPSATKRKPHQLSLPVE